MTCFKSANSWREWDVTPQIPKVQQTVSSDGAPPNPSSSQGHITSSDKHSYLFDVRTISYNICTYIWVCFYVFPGSFHIRICLVSSDYHAPKAPAGKRFERTNLFAFGIAEWWPWPRARGSFPQWRAITVYRCLWDEVSCKFCWITKPSQTCKRTAVSWYCK